MSVALEITVHGIPETVRAVEGDIERWQSELAYRIVNESRRLIDESRPAGQIRRRGSITARRTQRGIASGLKASGKTRMVVGSRIHRASAPGQPIAEDTGLSYRSISVTRMSKGAYRIRFAGWTGYWEFHAKESMRRKTIIPAIEIAVQKTFAESKIF